MNYLLIMDHGQEDNVILINELEPKAHGLISQCSAFPDWSDIPMQKLCSYTVLYVVKRSPILLVKYINKNWFDKTSAFSK